MLFLFVRVYNFTGVNGTNNMKGSCRFNILLFPFLYYEYRL